MANKPELQLMVSKRIDSIGTKEVVCYPVMRNEEGNINNVNGIYAPFEFRKLDHFEIVASTYNEGETYFRAEFEPWYVSDYRIAENMAKVLKRIYAHMTKLANDGESPQTFGCYVLEIANLFKIRKINFAITDYGSHYDENEYECLTIPDAIGKLNDMAK